MMMVTILMSSTRYKQDEDGFYRLQTVRYESIELNQEMMNEEDEDEDVDSPDASTVPSSPGSHSSQLTPRETAVQGNMNHVRIYFPLFANDSWDWLSSAFSGVKNCFSFLINLIPSSFWDASLLT